MDQKQFDAVLSDAEKRLRRLKVLYEQWFVGIERVEPAMPRKELEDMITRLRREQLSNTAQRFRLQQLVQRHVAFSTHWRRIGRQIEEGTYTRDLQRAKRRKGKHSEKEANGAELEGAYDVDVDVDLTDVLAEADRAADAALAENVSVPQPIAAEGQSPAAAAPKNGRVPARSLEVESEQMAPSQPEAAAPARSMPGQAAPQPLAAGAFQATKPKPADAAAAGQADKPVPNKAAAADPAALKTGAHAQPAAGGAPIPPKPARPLVPPPAAAGKLAAPKPLGGVAPPPPAAAGPGSERKPAAPVPAADQTSAGTLRAARTALRGAPAETAGAEARRPSSEPRAISPFALPAAGSVRPQPLTPPKAPPPPPVVPKAAAAQNASMPAGGNGGQPRRPEAMPRPAAGAARSPQPSAAAKPANTNGPGTSLDVERIYAQYVAARERNQERTDNVKRDTIEKTIRGMLPNLEKKHAGKKIDFEVVVKDGKVALKPIAK